MCNWFHYFCISFIIGIRERINEYIEKEKLTDEQFPVKKLIVLIPRSGFSFPTFSDVPSQTASDKDIEPAEVFTLLCFFL